MRVHLSASDVLIEIGEQIFMLVEIVNVKFKTDITLYVRAFGGALRVDTTGALSGCTPQNP